MNGEFASFSTSRVYGGMIGSGREQYTLCRTDLFACSHHDETAVADVGRMSVSSVGRVLGRIATGACAFVCSNESPQRRWLGDLFDRYV